MPVNDKDAKNAYQREYYRKRCEEDPTYSTKLSQNARRNWKRRSQPIRDLIEEFRKNGCVVCGEKEPCCLSAHHTEPGAKDFTVANWRRDQFSLDTVKQELEKCVCVCENCHRKIHAGIIVP